MGRGVSANSDSQEITPDSYAGYLRAHDHTDTCVCELIADELDQLREALVSIAVKRQDMEDWDHPDFDWKLLAHKQEHIARTALGTA